jgi:hypothetical protein
MPPRGLNGRVARTKFQKNTKEFSGNNPWNFDSFVTCRGRIGGGMCNLIHRRTETNGKPSGSMAKK